VTATDKHPLWVEGRRTWVDAADLRAGDELRRADGTTVEVGSTRVYEDPDATVYNRTVEGIHTYYAGAPEVLVHNCARGGPEPAPGRPDVRNMPDSDRVKGQTDAYHNFPQDLDQKIVNEGTVTQGNHGYVQYSMPGRSPTRSQRPGHYEVGIQNGQVVHRFFKPNN
jgi:hypothetical protein